MKKNYFLSFFILFLSLTSFGQVFITELADPNDNADARYVELYNAGNSAVDLTGWKLQRYTNANTTPSSSSIDDLTGSIPSKGFYIIAANPTVFNAAFGETADFDGNDTGASASNGDDQIELLNATGDIVDRFGVPGEKGTGTCHEFEDGRAERKAGVTNGNAGTWSEENWNVWADSTVNGCTSHVNAAQNVSGNFDPKAWIGTITTPLITVTANLNNFEYFEGNGPSASQSFSVEGNNLTNNLAVNAPTNFEISLTENSGYTTMVTINQTGGIANSTTIYVRMKSGLAVNNYSENVTISSVGATNKTVAVTGDVNATVPQITVTAFLSDFSYIISNGGPSAEDSFSVSGLFLTSNVTVTAPTNFEVSLASGTGFGDSVDLVPSMGTLTQTDVFVRLKSGLAENNYAGDIIVSATGITNETIAITGNAYGTPENKMIITGVMDGSLSGGVPKVVELYVLKNINDLSLFGLSSITNGAGSSAGNIEYTFPGTSVSAGTYIYIATETTGFNTFFGMMPTYTTNVVNINGDDSIELYEKGTIIDTFGDVNTDGSNQPWDYLDGWAYRKDNTGPEGTTFTVSNWTYSGINALDNQATNGAATTPFPIGTYQTTTASVTKNNIEGYAVYPNPVKANFTLTTASAEAKNISVYNVLGAEVLRAKKIGNRVNIDITGLNKGIYILKVEENGKIATQKLIVE